MAVVIAVDAGTTGVRALAVGDEGAPRGWSYREFTQHFPRPGWVEHDAAEIWRSVQTTLAELTAALDEPVAAIGITNQRETVVAWDRRTGRPRHRAIVWQDRRTARRCDELAEAGHLTLVRATTGLVLDPDFPASKVEWLLTEGGVDAGPDLAVGTIDSWLLWNLTGGAAEGPGDGSGGGVHATEASNASSTMLFDIGALRWSSELCDLFGVPVDALADVRPSSVRFGTTAGGGGIPAGVPVSGIVGDQQAALFGHACFAPWMTKNTYCTGSFVLMNAGPSCPEPVDGLLTTVAWTLADGTTAYAYEGSIFATGSAVQWLRDGLGIIADAAEVGPLAESCADTGGVVVVPAFTCLGSPWWDPYARATIVGITRGTGRAELARAVVEAMAHQTRDVVDAMTAACGHPVTGLRVDGGASVMDLLLQVQADQLQVPVVRPTTLETTALGAAYLAGLAEGVWGSLDELARHWTLDSEAVPAVSRSGADTRHRQWRRAVERSRRWVTA
ncbi:glycerol kinase GlpK [soil metagenome]